MFNPIRHITVCTKPIAHCVTAIGVTAIGVACLATVPQHAFAVGIQLLPGSSNFGTAGAGHAAEGNTAGSAWANPATMSTVDGHQIGFGMVLADTDFQFNGDDPNSEDGGDAGAFVTIPSFAYVHSISDDFKLGFAVTVPFGNEIDYGSKWSGSNAVTSAEIHTIQAQPVFSYRMNKHFSIGGGVNINYTEAKQELAPTGQTENRLYQLNINSELDLEGDDIAYGWTAGALWEFNDDHRIGVVYRSQVDSDLDGEASVDINYTLTPKFGSPSSGNLADRNLDSEFNWENPASVVLSGYHQVTERTALLWDLGRTFYSEFETTSIDVDGLPVSIDLERKWHDANRYAIGGHYKLTNDILLQAGFAYDESPVKTKYRTADMPLDDTKRYTVGAVYQMSEQLGLAIGLEYAHLGNNKIKDHGSLISSPAGDYDNTAVAGSLSFNYKF